MRVVALFTVFNERPFIGRAISHLARQGVESYVIDNESTDQTRDIVESMRGQGVIGVETLPRRGEFQLAAHLRRKEQLQHELGADWYIHHDADEIREAPMPDVTLAQAIAQVDAAGDNAIDFDEFVFLPTDPGDDFAVGNYVERMRHYLYLRPKGGARFRINAWKYTGQAIDLVSTGGHQVNFVGRRVHPARFILRHYMMLSLAHAVAKYCSRRYSQDELDERMWHGSREFVQPEDFRLPEASATCCLGSDGLWDRTRPVERLPMFGPAEERTRQKRRGLIRDGQPHVWHAIKRNLDESKRSGDR